MRDAMSGPIYAVPLRKNRSYAPQVNLIIIHYFNFVVFSYGITYSTPPQHHNPATINDKDTITPLVSSCSCNIEVE